MDVYAATRAYELAFSYRDIGAEVDALLGWATAASGVAPRSALELAAGPAEHAVELARRGIACTALDLSAPMCDRARSRAADAGVPLTVLHGDMREFALPQQVDLAVTMLDSVAHLVTPADLVRHLQAVGASVRAGGCYVVEMSHAKDLDDATSVTQSEWEQRAGDEHVHIRWGAAGDSVDPVTGIRQVTVALVYADGGGQQEIHEVLASREWPQAEFEEATAASGAWDIVGRYGSFDGVPLDAPGAWRMFMVLRRRPDAATDPA